MSIHIREAASAAKSVGGRVIRRDDLKGTAVPLYQKNPAVVVYLHPHAYSASVVVHLSTRVQYLSYSSLSIFNVYPNPTSVYT